MHRIDTARSIASPETPEAAGTPGHFSKGNPETGQKATAFSADWCEAVQEELMALLVLLGVTPSKANNGQIAAALATALALKAPLLNAALVGIPTAPTADPGTNTTQISTTAFVHAAIAALVNSSPEVLDTLKELADALGDDANFAVTMANALALKAPIASPALTGTPTAPTPSSSDNSTRIATTEWLWNLFSHSTNSVKLPGGLLIQCGTKVITTANSAFAIDTVTLPTPFATSTYYCPAPGCKSNVGGNPATTGGNYTAIAYGQSASGFSIRIDNNSSTNESRSVYVDWIAIGLAP